MVATRPSQKPKPVIFHGHCHQKALVGTGPAVELLSRIPGVQVADLDAGCCGMAGSFGYYTNHYDISMQIGEQNLFPSIRGEDTDTIIISEGVSCREQIEQGTGRKSKHLVEILAEYL